MPSAQAVLARLPADDGSDPADATRGKIAEIPGGLIRTADGKTVWDAGAFAFLEARNRALPASTRRCGGMRGSTISTACSRSCPARCGRCAAMTLR